MLVFDPSYPDLVLSVRDVEFSSGCRCPELNLFGFKILGWTPEREAPGNRRRHTRIGTAGGGRRKRLKKSQFMGGESGGGFVSTKGFHKMRDRGAATTERPVVIVFIIYNMAAAGNFIRGDLFS